MTRPRLSPAIPLDFKRERLLRAAADLVVLKGGVDEVRIGDLVSPEYGSVARKTLYDIFPQGKDQVVGEALKWAAEDLTALLAAAVEQGDTCAEQIACGIATAIAWVTLNPAPAGLLFVYGGTISFEDWLAAISGLIRLLAPGEPTVRDEVLVFGAVAIITSALRGASDSAQLEADLNELHDWLSLHLIEDPA